MHKIKREFFNESQITDNVIGKSFNLDTIVKNSKNQNMIEIIIDKIRILRIDLRLVNFTEDVLTYQHKKLHIRILEGAETIDQIFDQKFKQKPKIGNYSRPVSIIQKFKKIF